MSVTSPARMGAQSFQARMEREKPSRRVERWNQPQPMTLRQVKSVRQSWFGAVVCSVNASAAFATTKAGRVIRSCALSRR